GRSPPAAARAGRSRAERGVQASGQTGRGHPEDVMTTTAHSPAEHITELPPDGANAQARTRTREGQALSGGQLAGMQRVVGTLLAGDSLLHRQPPSVAQTWARHLASARHCNTWMLRWPRYGWGAAHTVLYSVISLVGWVTSSLPLLLVTTGALWIAHWYW